MGRRALTKNQFIARAIKTHGNRYNYTKVFYEDSGTEVCIICPLHGEFFQLPYNHLRGKGCLICSGKSQKTTDLFIQNVLRIHGNSYDYSKVEYINNKTKVKITCPKHGEFKQTPNHHINDKNGCPRCVKSGYSKISIQFLNDLSRNGKLRFNTLRTKGNIELRIRILNATTKLMATLRGIIRNMLLSFRGITFMSTP